MVVLALGCLAPSAARGESVHLHVRVETAGGPGQQSSRFWAYTTADQAGTQAVPVPRLCVRGTGHQTQERCEQNVSAVEVVERTTGLPGVGSRCVEALATAEWGPAPITATARACP
jgi:hypothetical protein